MPTGGSAARPARRRNAVRRTAQAGRRGRRRCSSAATCSWARTGTVTHIDGDRVYAFGHPMYNLGPTEFPMTRAYVYTVLPSLFSSMKLSTASLEDRPDVLFARVAPQRALGSHQSRSSSTPRNERRCSEHGPCIRSASRCNAVP